MKIGITNLPIIFVVFTITAIYMFYLQKIESHRQKPELSVDLFAYFANAEGWSRLLPTLQRVSFVKENVRPLLIL